MPLKGQSSCVKLDSSVLRDQGRQDHAELTGLGNDPCYHMSVGFSCWYFFPCLCRAGVIEVCSHSGIMIHLISPRYCSGRGKIFKWSSSKESAASSDLCFSSRIPPAPFLHLKCTRSALPCPWLGISEFIHMPAIGSVDWRSSHCFSRIH